MSVTAPTNIFQVFCSNGVNGTDYEIPPTTDVDNSIVSQPLGAPPIMEEPITAGGLAFLRKQFNGSMRLYSQFILWLINGGYFTFDPDVSTANTGYPDNAILFDVATQRFIISLHDDNTEDFVSDPSKINGTDWQFLDVFGYASNIQALARSLTNVGLTPANIAALFPNLIQSGNDINIGLTSTNPIIKTTNGNTRGSMPNAGTANDDIATVGEVDAVGAGILSLALSNTNLNGLLTTGTFQGGSIGGNKLTIQTLYAYIGDIPSPSTTYTFTLSQAILTSNFPYAVVPVVEDSTATVYCAIDGYTIVAGNITQVTISVWESASVTQSVALRLLVIGYRLP